MDKLPFATLRYTYIGHTKRCEVLIDGEPVAQLPAEQVTLTAPWNDIPKLAVWLRASEVGDGIQTIQPYMPDHSPVSDGEAKPE